MGVSGFLISCAIRRATSPHAAILWALTKSVTSSKATTKPSRLPPSFRRVAMRTNRFSNCPLRLTLISLCEASPGPLRKTSNKGPNSGTATANGTICWSSCQSNNLAADLFTKATRPSGSKPTTPDVTELRTESNIRRRRSIWPVLSNKVSRWPLSWRVIWLKYRPSIAISSSPSSSRT